MSKKIGFYEKINEISENLLNLKEKLDNVAVDFLKDEEQIIIDDLEKLKPIIKDIKFNAIYIIGFNYKDVYEYFMKSEKVLTLF